MTEKAIASYVRTSLEDYGKAHRLIDQSLSIVNQKRMILDFISQHDDLSGAAVIDYVDDGFTGTNIERPRFQDLLRDVQSGRIGAIIVKDLSRLGRSYLEVGNYLERVFPLAGVRVIAINDHYDSGALSGTTGGLDVAFRNFIYDSYSKDLSVKVKTAMHTRMEKGRFVNHPPYGYTKSPEDKHRLIPDPATAPIVREIFTSVLNGMTTSQVAKALNERRVPTPLQYKQHKLKSACQDRELLWSHVQVLNVLHNIKYTGVMVNHIRESRHLRDTNQRRTAPEEWIITENAHPAIVSREEFDAANARLRHGHPPPHRGSGSPSDAVFYCGHCGRKLRKTHGKDTYFSCETSRYQPGASCAGLRWEKGALEAVLLQTYQVQLQLLEQRVEQQQRQTHPTASRIADFIRKMGRLERDMDACDREKLELFEAYHEGALALPAFLEQKLALSERRDRLHRQYTELEEEHRAELDAERQQAQTAAQAAAVLSANQLPREELLQQMYRDIDRVYLTDLHELHVRWKFQDLLSGIVPAEEIA